MRTYPSGYSPKKPAEQIALLQRLFPELGLRNRDEWFADEPLQHVAEGWLACPPWQLLADTYCAAIRRVIAVLRTQRMEFSNPLEFILRTDRIKSRPATVQARVQLTERQTGHNVLVFPFQSGSRFQGATQDQVLGHIQNWEWPLGLYEVGILLATHPAVLGSSERLWVACPGDVTLEEDGQTREDLAIFYYHNGFGNGLEKDFSQSARGYYACATGFTTH
jgi:hypothetical protein